MGPSLFKWHASSYVQQTDPLYQNHAIHLNGETCPWCASPLLHAKESPDLPPIGRSADSFYTRMFDDCPCCGWWIKASGWYNISVHTGKSGGAVGILREFPIDSADVTLQELGTHLRTRFADAYNLPWRLFEQLVEDVFRQHGFRTRLTQATRDDGADIILLDDGGAKQAIVQVKRFRSDRKVGIGIVRELIGAQLIHDVGTSYLVTSSSFTRDAATGAQLAQTNAGLTVELWDAMRLLQTLDCYDEAVLAADAIVPSLPLHEQVARQRSRSER